MKSAKPGLTLVEVILAALIVSIGSISLLGLQGFLMRGVFSAHVFVERLGFIKSFFVEIDKNQLFKRGAIKTKVLEDPQLTMSYVQKKPATKSLEASTGLVVDQVEAEWPTPLGVQKEFFARLSFRPKKEHES